MISFGLKLPLTTVIITDIVLVLVQLIHVSLVILLFVS
jgi:hypothetical protein